MVKSSDSLSSYYCSHGLVKCNYAGWLIKLFFFFFLQDLTQMEPTHPAFPVLALPGRVRTPLELCPLPTLPASQQCGLNP